MKIDEFGNVKIVMVTSDSIKQLEAENRQLREALEIGIRWMDEWLKNNLCECEGVHTCGKKERTKELEYMKQALEGGSE